VRVGGFGRLCCLVAGFPDLLREGHDSASPHRALQQCGIPDLCGIAASGADLHPPWRPDSDQCPQGGSSRPDRNGRCRTSSGLAHRLASHPSLKTVMWALRNRRAEELISRAFSIRMSAFRLPCQEISLAPSGKSVADFRASRAYTEGRFAVVTKRGAGCDGRFGAVDERAQCGRRNRVVLISRCRDQVRGWFFTGDGG
jgi:hypothetical protein